MKHLTPVRRPALTGALSAVLVVVAGACGSSTTSSEGTAATTEPPSAGSTTSTVVETTVPPDTTVAPETTAAPETTEAPETTAAPTTAAPTTAAPTTAAPPVSSCANLPGSPAFGSTTVDLLGDGTADDLLESFVTDAGNGALRLTTGGGVVSTYEGTVEDQIVPIDVVDVYAGGASELVANLGGGDVAFTVALFTADAEGCLTMLTYADRGGEEARFLIQPSGPVRAGAFCSPGAIDVYGGEQDTDGTWIVYSAAYEAANETQIQYLGASDGYAEGLDESEIGSFEFDCLGVILR